MNSTLATALRRKTLAVTVALLALLTLGFVGPATAAAPSAGGSGVTGNDLPKTTRVDNTFPYLRGGSRFTFRAKNLEYSGARCTGTKTFRAESARFAAYTTESGDSPFHVGLEDPTFVVYQFADAATARQGMRKVTSYARRCRGTFTSDGVSTTLTKFRVPALGKAQVGYRTVNDDSEFRSQSVEIYVLHGRRIERSWIQLDDGRASRAHVVRMARVLADVAR